MSPSITNNTQNVVNSKNTSSAHISMYFVGVGFIKLVPYSEVEKSEILIIFLLIYFPHNQKYPPFYMYSDNFKGFKEYY